MVVQTEKDKEFESRHADELSASRYAMKQLRMMGITIASPILGALAGSGIGGLIKMNGANAAGDAEDMAKTVEKADGWLKRGLKLVDTAPKMIGAGAGAFVGLLAAGLIQGYEHWRKVETARLAAKEVNEDISKVRILEPTNPELLAENKRLRTMLNELDAKPVSHAKDHKPTDHKAHDKAHRTAEHGETHHADRHHDHKAHVTVDASSLEHGRLREQSKEHAV